MTQQFNFFKKYYNSNFKKKDLHDITSLYLNDIKLTAIQPNLFEGLDNLVQLNLKNNKLTVLQPGTFNLCINLRNLNLSHNKLTVLEQDNFEECDKLLRLNLKYNKIIDLKNSTFQACINLRNLNLSYNNLTVLQQGIFKGLNNLTDLNLSNNNLTLINNGTFDGLVNLNILNLCCNNLTSLPIEIITLDNLTRLYYIDNPLEIDPIIERFLDIRIINSQGTLYNDSQNVHSYGIQESVRKSIFNILKDEQKEEKSYLKEVLEDDVLTATTKSLLTEYLQDTTSHSTLFVTFEDLFKRVWNRIKTHRESTELKQILNQEMKESECKCFTGRLSRLVNVISGGFFVDVNVTIQSSEQLAYVIAMVKERLEREECYTVEKHREIVAKELSERGYESDVIKVWTDEI